MKREIISTDKAPAAVGPYVQAVRMGDFLFASGQLGLIPESGQLPEGIEAQTRQALANVNAVLEEAGFSRNDVVKTTVFLSDIGNFSLVNEIYGAFFGDSKPARSCVEVSALPKGGLVEIEITAVRQTEA